MKIAVASDDGKTIASHFGRTRGFVLMNISDKQITTEEYIINDFTGHALGMEGHDHSHDRHGPILHALKECDVVISHGMGRRIYIDLQEAGKQVFITPETEVQKAVELYIQGKLEDRPDLGCNHHNH
jgi:predicted Fe-Mo cluster-binding NifX family protein